MPSQQDFREMLVKKVESATPVYSNLDIICPGSSKQKETWATVCTMSQLIRRAAGSLQMPSAFPNPPWSPGSHIRLLKHELAAQWQTRFCMCACVCERYEKQREGAQEWGIQNVCIWHQLLYFTTPSYSSLLSVTIYFLKSPEGDKS